MPTEAEIQAADEMVQAWHNRPRRRVASPSPRTPETSWHFNHADLIERQLQENGDHMWGFVIYRTCYGNDEDWAEFLKRLRLRMEASFDFYNGRDILALFVLTVIEDPEHLDGASTAAVREHFLQWSATAPQLEHQEQPQQPQQPQHHLQQRLQEGRAVSEIRIRRTPRYRYAIQVDAASLHSVVHDSPAPPEPDLTKLGWVKLIDASWLPISSERLRDTFEPLEGVVEKDVGWMKVPYSHVMDEYYMLCGDKNWWVTSYQRPPTVMGYPYGNELG